ncbi:MAG: winged helix-turn-helix transcriptional regulator [Deltaproteobacteria bacterium]|nr:winged helix-turn-helix transcriptional regulator [Deltaproteobacteria bacterium]MBW1930803.1 winged helix-turn-helix transcriptional regulator [Deltaproteobacteria bacterium]MBW2024716.1 winged helix-turn-helix transcriptional regulator [Deltaproteobacteria bacterium]MBW2125479.1 winged helix-turn-helix transcriptional regulator [Deltaproteobacteria bacterium]RLB19076.1 MAG: hypothetical protein DRG63_01515 [Deltaproteobacteria bacterium]
MNSLVSFFKALSDDNRFKILEMLLNGDFCVGALANRLGISRAAVSQHLRILSRAGLVRGEKRGYWTHYIVNRSALKEVAESVAKMSRPRQAMATVCLRSLPMAMQISGRMRLDRICMDCGDRPEKLKGKRSDRSPERVKECHADTKGHPYLEERKKTCRP